MKLIIEKRVVNDKEVYGIVNNNGKTVVEFEYDSIDMADENGIRYAILKKDAKYGALKFEYDKKEEEYKTIEMASCIYNKIEKIDKTNVRYGFIGSLDDEVRLITVYKPHGNDKSDKTYTEANGYTKITHLANYAYLMELKHGYKNHKALYKLYEKENDTCYVKLVHYVSDAEMCGKLLKLTRDGQVRLFENEKEKLHPFFTDYVEDAFYDKDNDIAYIKQYEAGYICLRLNDYVSHMFDTDSYGIKYYDISSISFENLLNVFKIVDPQKVIRIYPPEDQYLEGHKINKLTVFNNRTFTKFNVMNKDGQIIVGYTEVTPKGKVTKMVEVDIKNNTEHEINDKKKTVEDVVLEGTKTIYSETNLKTNVKKYGVIDSSTGNTCIECAFDKVDYITVLSDNNVTYQLFACQLDDEICIYDQNGVLWGTLTIPKIGNQKNSKLTLNNNADKKNKK